VTWEDIIKAVRCPQCRQKTFKYAGHTRRLNVGNKGQKRRRQNMMECSNPECGYSERIA
jgi:hypothetical protein